MSTGPTVASIFGRLERAQRDTQVVVTSDGRPRIVEMCEAGSQRSHRERRRDLDRYMDEGIWRAVGSGFQLLQEWVDAHWNPEDEGQAPRGTVATGEDWGWQEEPQLDAVAATRKLIAAAQLYGCEEATNHATEFATHGMIEVNRVCLLKGPPIKTRQPLDEYCSLLPYSEALRKIEAESDPGDLRCEWPERDAENVCALDCRYFESGFSGRNRFRQYTSPLLKDGPEALALLLGLVWGTGLRSFGNWRAVPKAAEAALPFRHGRWGSGAGSRRVSLPIKGYGPSQGMPPLAVSELQRLAPELSETSGKARQRLVGAMARLRKSTEREDPEDLVIDLGIALAILFMEEDEQIDEQTLIPRRAAWLYADSGQERRRAEDMIGRFCAYHSKVAHGRVSGGASPGDRERRAKLCTDADDLLRACLMTIIAEGWPEDWNDATEGSRLRLDPPRTEAETPSMKSDCLSWSVKEQKEIDRSLEAVWGPVVETAPLPPPDMGSTTVHGILPQLVSDYSESGIPYVIVHPARLYMAHPKWPQTSSEPLDERTEYYCARDVIRHMRQWRETAAEKGLVQFEVKTDASLYHPKRREDWPLPLLSSHETGAGAEAPGEQAGTVESDSPSTAVVAETAPAQHSSADEETTAPARELPESTVGALRIEWSRLWEAFKHDVNVLTSSLLYVLEGIHSKHLAERRRVRKAMESTGSTPDNLEQAMRAYGEGYAAPTYPKLRALPVLSGEPLLRRTEPDGPMERLAFKGWLREVYYLWERHYRNQLKHEIRHLTDAIHPRQDVLGDLKDIRNDLVHKGIARRGKAADCTILRWFTRGEEIQIRLRHVLDFLNQMGWLSESTANLVQDGGRSSSWHIDREGELETPTPQMISVRPVVNPLHGDPRYRYGVCVAFDDGVFGATPMGPEREETKAHAQTRMDRWLKTVVNEAGDLDIPSLGTVPAAKLYAAYLQGERGRGPGIWGPWVQFREGESSPTESGSHAPPDAR